MADSVTSQVQHITALDFDMTKALQQLQELQDRFNAITQEIASRNWSIKAVIDGSDGFDEMEEKAKELNEQITTLKEKISGVSLTGVQKSTQEIKQLQAELKLLESIYAKDSDSLEALQAKSQKYNEIAAEQKKLVDSLSVALKSAEKSYGVNSDQAAQFRLQLTNAQTALQNTQNSADTAAKAMQRYANESTSTEKAIAQLNAEMKLLDATYANDSSSLEYLEKKCLKYNDIAREQEKVVADLSEKLKFAENEYGKTSEEATRLRTELTNAQTALQNTKNSAGDAAKAVQEFGTETNDAADNTNELNEKTSTLISTIETRLVSALSQAAKAGYEAVKSTEDSMVEIGRVLDTTASETETLRGSLFELGNEYGRSFEDVSDVALRFAQAGYDMNDTISNTKALLLGMNTAELEASSGTTELIGILSQWGMEASELTTVIDKLNYTADNNAVTTQDLADALLKASSMAKTAGMNFDDTVGVLTAMKVASGAAGKEVGNAFKSIIAYIQRPESLKLFDNMGIDVFKDKVTGELLPMMDILKSMTEKWNSNQEEMLDTLIASGDAAQMMSEEWAIATGSLDEYNQYQEAAAAATDKANDAESRAQAQAAAGVFRRNYYIALMENFNKAIEVSADLINSEGHSEAENARYMETLTAKTEQLVVALTELAVTAADAGLLDLAKQAIDTATAITKWTTETKTLIPTLTMVGSLLVTIKSQKIATEISAIGGAFGNAFNALKGGASTITGIKTAASGATVAATGLSSALGGIGIALAGISLVTAAIKAAEAAIDELEQRSDNAREETIALADSEKERYEVLEQTRNIFDELSDRYDELSAKTSLTTDEIEELDNITAQLTETQDKLTEAYGSQAEAIDLINGKRDEQIEKLNELNEKELQYLRNTQRNAIDAQKEKNARFNDSATKEYKQDNFTDMVEFGLNYTDENAGYSYNRITRNGDKASIEIDASAESLERLKLVLEKIEEQGGKNSDSWSMVYEAIVNVEGELSKTKDLYAELAETQFSIYNNNSNFEEVGREGYLAWRNGLLATAEGDTELENALTALFAKKFPEQDRLADLDAIKNMTDAEKAYYLAKKNSIVATETSVKASRESAEAIGEAAEQLELTEEELEALSKTISSSESNITSLNKYMETLAEGNGLTAEQVMELCETYGLLADQFTLTEKGYTIEVSALEELRDKQIETAATARLEQAGYTEEVVANILKRIRAYSDEVKGISSVADAQLALEKLKLQLSDAEANAHINSQYDYANYMEQTADLRDLIGETESYASTLEYLDSLQNDLYQNLGKSYSGTTEKTDEADKAFKALIESIERLGEMGIYSTEEVIEKFEELRRTAGYTEDQIKSIEDKLHELYSSQVEESLKATEEEYKDYVQSVKDKYDADKEALEKLLDDEMDMFKEQQSDELDARKEYWNDEIDNLKDSINAQINASKKAYETKKKLIDKSYDNQADALESLRDMELNNIKASYDAQISALEKIKAARQAQRDEEDYQDERAELLEQISYWEQRTGTEAVENLESLKKQLADLDKEHQRDLEDKEIDGQIDSLEEQRDNETAAVKAQYDAQISALKLSKETELEIYESTYNAEQEMLKEKLEKDVKAMEDARDADLKALQKKQKEDLKLLEEEHEKKLKDLEDEKDAAIKAAEEKWAAIEQMFNDSNTAMVASAGMFASDIYDQFNMLFTQRFEMDLEQLRILMSQLNAEKSAMESMSGTRPTTSYSSNTYGSMSKNSYGNFSSKNKVVKANTGGKTTADGLVMLHKNELIINPPTTKKLEDLLEMFSPPKTGIVVDPSIMRSINRTAAFFHAPRENSYNTNNNYNSNSYDNSRPIINNFNAPLQNIEKIEDAADMEAATNAIERKLMRELSTKL